MLLKVGPSTSVRARRSMRDDVIATEGSARSGARSLPAQLMPTSDTRARIRRHPIARNPCAGGNIRIGPDFRGLGGGLGF